MVHNTNVWIWKWLWGEVSEFWSLHRIVRYISWILTISEKTVRGCSTYIYYTSIYTEKCSHYDKYYTNRCTGQREMWAKAKVQGKHSRHTDHGMENNLSRRENSYERNLMEFCTTEKKAWCDMNKNEREREGERKVIRVRMYIFTMESFIVIVRQVHIVVAIVSWRNEKHTHYKYDV